MLAAGEMGEAGALPPAKVGKNQVLSAAFWAHCTCFMSWKRDLWRIWKKGALYFPKGSAWSPFTAQLDQRENSCLRLPCWGALGWPKKEQNTWEVSETQSQTQALSQRAEDHPLSCFTWPLWLGQSPSVARASSPVWGQEETRSKFLWDMEGRQGKDPLSSLPGAAMGQETEAEGWESPAAPQACQQIHKLQTAASGRRECWPLKWQPQCCSLGTCCSPCFPFVPVQKLLTVFGLSDCIWIIYFYPPAPLQGPLSWACIRGEPGSCSVQPPLALGSAWLQRAVISQPALLSSSQWHHPLWLYKAQGGSLYLCVLFAHSFSCLSVQHTCKSHCRNWALFCLNQNCTAEKGVGAKKKKSVSFPHTSESIFEEFG